MNPWIILIASVIIPTSVMANAGERPVSIHPDNPKYFLFRNKPLVLVTATEHYGAVINRPFNFERYLADAAKNKMTFTRLLVLFRELQTPINPYSTCKPESPDFITPFLRTGPGKAADGQLKYNLDKWNPEFFDRLNRFLSLAAEYRIIVEITLFSNTYANHIWELNPLNPRNNLNDKESIEWPDYTLMRHPKLLERQKAHVRKIVESTKHFDNVIYEICNDPDGAAPGNPANPTLDEVNKWMITIGNVIRESEKDLTYKHLIVGQEAYGWAVLAQASDKAFNEMKLDVVNMHPLPNMRYKGKIYMGDFISKQLKLQQVRDFCLATYSEPKPLNLDEDNVASRYKDFEGWTIHRKRAWTTLFSEGHYGYIGFSIINYSEAGTESSQRHLRNWFRNLSEFIHSIDVIHSKPLTGWLKKKPDHLLEVVLAEGDRQFNIYLADDREREMAGAGAVVKGSILMDLPPGEFDLGSYSPPTGSYSPTIRVNGRKNLEFALPEFQHDIVIQIRRVK